MARKNTTHIGGQAVMEGVMMRGKTAVATAVRKGDGNIIVESKRLKEPNSIINKIPILRGIINFASTLIMGTKILLRSAEVVEDEIIDKPKKSGKVDLYNVAIFVSALLGIGLAILLFIVLPQFVVSGIEKLFNWEGDAILKNLVSGLIRIVIFFCYILLVSNMKDIKRVFMYHGAEHKTISCYEEGLDLTVENVKKCSKVHDRCGTNFLFIVMAVSILFFSLVVGWQENVIQRVAVRILLLPVVAGLSYEVLKILAKFDNAFVRAMKAPGRLLQKFTTAEPTDDMIEVAITSFTTVLAMENDPTIPETEFDLSANVDSIRQDITRILNDKEIFEPADVDWILCHITGKSRAELPLVKNISKESAAEARRLAKERASGRPLQYVLGYTEFYGLKFKTDERALIPRFDTEILAEEAVFYAKGKKCLDLCTGSGALGITLALNGAESVVLSDVSDDALNLAMENATSLGANVIAVKSDMFANIQGEFDLIVSNPPYIPTLDLSGLSVEVKREPVLALDGGTDGLDYYRIIAQNAGKYLTEGGILALEIGINQSADVVSLITDNNFEIIKVKKDYSDIDRVIVAKKKA